MEANAQARTDMRFHGAVLRLARAGWLGATLLSAGLFAMGLPEAFALLRTICAANMEGCEFGRLTQESVPTLLHLGISVDAYAAGYLAFSVALTFVWWSLAALIFWRKSDEGMALLVALMFVIQGTTSVTEVIHASGGPYGVLNTLGWMAIMFVMFLFPDGRFVPGWSGWLATAVATVMLLSAVFPVSMLNFLSHPVIYVIFLGVIMAAQVYRYRKVSGPVERQQTKWVVYGLVTYVIGVGALLVVGLITGALDAPGSIYSLFMAPVISLCWLAIPLSFALAILRSRLYNIDVIINRTLIYGMLSVTLALVYTASVVLLQSLFNPLLGAGNGLAVVISTLAIAALFMPLRRWTQGFIDKRFYRRKYDAAMTLQAFSATLRDEVDLEKLTSELVEVVHNTMQPSHISVWLVEREQAREATAP
jgi:hypothetical protein